MHVYVPAHVLYVSVTGPAAIVTGASTGIGRSVAVALACKQFLVFAGVRRESDAAALADAAAQRGCSGSMVPVIMVCA